MIDFNGRSTCLGLYHALSLGNHIHIYIFCVFFFFCTWSYQIQMVFKQISLTHRQDFTPLGQKKPGSNGNEVVLHTSQNWSLTIRCSLILHSGHPFWGGDAYPSVWDAVSIFWATLTEQELTAVEKDLLYIKERQKIKCPDAHHSDDLFCYQFLVVFSEKSLRKSSQ